MFKTIILFFIIGFIIFTTLGRFLAYNIHNILYYMPLDIYKYFKYKKYNECPYYGFIKIFNGYFGSGKSLSAVDEVISHIYRRYNGRLVWSEELQSFIKQKITIVTNLELKGCPYVPFENEQQFINYETALGEVVIFLIDEIGAIWNNRDFKNFNPELFNKIVQSRKRKIAIVGTLPKIIGTDINIRRYTDDVIVCSKTWRIIKHRYFKADELENCTNIDMLEPFKIEYKFVLNRMYEQYDTNAIIDKLKKDMEDGKLLSFAELGANSADGDFRQANLKKKYRKRQK
ncbi:MAG: hypothetical protein E7258_04785 [Lachnospiraceae bacterium]|nr:hypothetical protein [Lachnospiraceae bacterium]